MFLHASVILCTGECGRQTPPHGRPLQRTVRILLECILVLVTSVVQIHVFVYLHLLLVAHNLVLEFQITAMFVASNIQIYLY